MRRMPIIFDRFQYRAWRLENGLVIRCICERMGDDFDISWELYNPSIDYKRHGTEVITREDAKSYLKKSHIKCDFYGELD